jgi:hypothetical protein
MTCHSAVPATLLRFAQDMDRLGLAYHYRDDDHGGYDLYWEGQVVYSVPSRKVWREWGEEVLAEVVTAVNLHRTFS